ncbi:Hypothetical predicted protein [Octopus vulgaris]|uniref:Uncharacterized protein n=1 Tax=Octopus vulgaris TaxID=6645 RepID=A0AA36BKL4_OCTVU|nr:Hypothetical predicted protein [Octopus vulgaris]
MDFASTSYQCTSDINEDSCDSCDNDDNDIDFVPENELKENQEDRFTYQNKAITADKYRDYVDFSNWENEFKSSLPVLRNFTNLDLLKARSEPLTAIPLPCRVCQEVEYAINLVTKAS